MIPSIDAIIAAVIKVTDTNPRGSRRNRSGLLARRVAVYSLRVMRNMSYPEIGMALGVSHSTAIESYAVAEHDAGVMAAATQVRRLLDMEVV